MKVFNPMQLGVNHRVLEKNRKFFWIPSFSLYFNIRTGKVFQVHEVIEDVMASLDQFSLPDMGMPKPYGEWLVSGHGYSYSNLNTQNADSGPEKIPKVNTATQLSVEIGQYKKAINLFGDRVWSLGLPTSPEPFEKISLSYESSFGSNDFPMNPAGKGYLTDSLPNFEYASQVVDRNDGHFAPAGFSCLDPSWPQRAQHTGTYDQHYLEKFYPGYPEDMDLQLFMTTANDQWLPGFFSGSETFHLKGLHPSEPTLSGKLPDIRLRSFIASKTSDKAEISKEKVETEFREIKTDLDTVWFFPDCDAALLVWRGSLEVKDDEASDILAMISGYEYTYDDPKPVQHYLNSLKTRISKSNAINELLISKDLIPDTDGTLLESLSTDSKPLEDALSNNLKAKAKSIETQVEKGVADLIEKSKGKLLDDSSGSEKLQKALDYVNSDNKSEAHPMQAILENHLSGVSKGENLDLDKFSFDQVEKMFGEIDSEIAKDKQAIIEKLKLDLSHAIDTQPEANLSQEVKQYQEEIEKIISALESSLGNSSEIELSKQPLPRLDVSQLKKEFQDNSERLNQSKKELHLIKQNPFTPEEQLERIENSIRNLEEAESIDITEELNKAYIGFLEGYRLSAHYSEEGFSPHRDTQARKEQLLRLISLGEDVSNQDWACLDLSGQDLQGVDFTNCLLEQVDFTGARLKNVNFTGAVMARAVMDRAECTDCIFEEANLGNIRIDKGKFERSNFSSSILAGSKITSSSLTRSIFSNIDFVNCVLSSSNFTGSEFSNSKFLELQLQHLNFESTQFDTSMFFDCKLHESSFIKARLEGTVWTNCLFRKTKFDHAVMPRNCFVQYVDDSLEPSLKDICGTLIENEKAFEADSNKATVRNQSTFFACSFLGADLEYSNFQGLSLTDVNFENANLQSANFSEAICKEGNFQMCIANQANFQKSNLAYGKFISSSLREATLAKANIVGANFSSANLYGVDFLRSEVLGTDFRRANLDGTVMQNWRPSK